MNSSKTKIYCLFAASVILMLFGAISFFLCFTGEFDADIGHFAVDTVFAPVMYGCMAAGAICGVTAWILFARFDANNCISAGSPLMCTVIYTLCAVSFVADAAADTIKFFSSSAAGQSYQSYIFSSVGNAPAVLHYLLWILGVLAGMCMVVCALKNKFSEAIRALAGFVPPIFLAIRVIISYFSSSVAVNSPAKLTLQIALICFMLAFTVEEGINVQRKNMFPRLMFTLCVSTSIGGAVGIGMLMVFISGGSFPGGGVVDALMLTILAASCGVKLFFTKDAKLEYRKKKSDGSNEK